MRKRYIAGNWKMNTTLEEGVSLARSIAKRSEYTSDDTRLVIAPPFTALDAIRRVVEGTKVELAAQNVASESSGAHTGEVSAAMLKSVGVTTIIVGHSERRTIYKENDAFINTKVRMALSENLRVILCVGETLEEREADKVHEVVDNQLVGGLASIDETQLINIVIAYEPVWAIGTGKTATPDVANEVHAMIRNRIRELYSENAASSMMIAYGGSVTPANAVDLLGQEHIDGALIGGASLKVDSFIGIATS